jgi:hypothetical protein
MPAAARCSSGPQVCAGTFSETGFRLLPALADLWWIDLRSRRMSTAMEMAS